MSLKIYNTLHRVVRESDKFCKKWIKYFQENYSSDVKQKIESGMCIDAGCGGTRKGAKLINTFNPDKLIVCDINPDHQELYIDQKFSKFLCADIASLPFENDFFDFILCNGVAHHTPDPFASITELYRVLKPGGVIHISVYCFKHSLFHYFVLLLRLFAKIVPFRFAKLICSNNFLLNVPLNHAFVHRSLYSQKIVNR